VLRLIGACIEFLNDPPMEHHQYAITPLFGFSHVVRHDDAPRVVGQISD
jgi:hypothetical protein